MSKRFILTILTLIVIGLAASVAIFLAKGYRISPQEGVVVVSTGILSVTSIPDKASVYLDGHLTAATNSNINSLPPKTYKVKIIKDGFISWEKEVAVKQGLVTEVKATLFRSIATIYPLTYNGVENILLSPDEQKVIFIVQPEVNEDSLLTTRKAGVWVWEMNNKPIAFARGGEPHQILQNQSNIDFSKATFRWSPDSESVILILPDRYLLLNVNSLNDPPKDITAVAVPTLKSWDDDKKSKQIIRLETINNLSLKKIASSSAVLKWAPDETKFLYSVNGKNDFKVVDLLLNKTYLMQSADSYVWLPDSEHLLLVELQEENKLQNNQEVSESNNLKKSKISVIEYDNSNKAEIYVGILDPKSVFIWPDGSRLVIISSQPTATASKPNLYGINLK